MIQLRTFNAPGGIRTIDPADLTTALTTMDPAAQAVFFHGAGPAGSVLRVWIIDDEHCRVELREGGRWYDLVESDEIGETEVDTACIPGSVPTAAVLPHAQGLEVLRMAGDGPRLHTAYRWRPVPHWVVDRGEYLLRDVVEAMTEHATDLYMGMTFRGESDADAPIGLRHLAHLWTFHSVTMGHGFGWVRDEYSDPQLEVAAAAASYMGLDDIARLIGRLVAEDQDSDLAEAVLNPVYRELSETGDGDASVIRDAIRRSVDENPADWGLD